MNEQCKSDHAENERRFMAAASAPEPTAVYTVNGLPCSREDYDFAVTVRAARDACAITTNSPSTQSARKAWLSDVIEREARRLRSRGAQPRDVADQELAAVLDKQYADADAKAEAEANGDYADDAEAAISPTRGNAS